MLCDSCVPYFSLTTDFFCSVAFSWYNSILTAIIIWTAAHVNVEKIIPFEDPAPWSCNIHTAFAPLEVKKDLDLLLAKLTFYHRSNMKLLLWLWNVKARKSKAAALLKQIIQPELIWLFVVCIALCVYSTCQTDLDHSNQIKLARQTSHALTDCCLCLHACTYLTSPSSKAIIWGSFLKSTLIPQRWNTGTWDFMAC